MRDELAWARDEWLVRQPEDREVPNLEAGGIRQYDFLENRVMAGQNFTWNENESYA